MTSDVIGIPLGTRLIALVIVETDEGVETQVWIARRMMPDGQPWQGTYISVKPNGKVTRVTIDDHNPVPDDEFVIKDVK